MARTGQILNPHRFLAAAWTSRAVLLVDVVESVRLAEQDELDFISRWLALVEQVKLEILPQCQGHYVKSLGDGMLLDFADARSAVAAAFAIQQSSNCRNLGLPPEQRILLRMGIELSDVIIDQHDLFGRGVNRAARLLTLAGPGEIVVSANVRDRLAADLDADIEDLGECYLKHIPQAVRAYRVGAPGPRPVIEPSVPLSSLAPSLAVVPFTTRDAGDEYHLLGEVLAEELIRDLSGSPEVNVISRLSTTVFRDRDATAGEIGAILNVNYVLSGAYRVSGQRILVDAELAQGKSGQVVWTQSYTGKISDVLSGNRGLLGQMAADVTVGVMTRELQQARSQPLPTLESYTLLIAAIALMHRLSSSNFDEARKFLEALIERAPRQAAPRAWLAKWHVLLVWQGWSPDPQRDTRLALQSTRQALDADPDCSLALVMDGLVQTNLMKRLDIAQERYELALTSNPSNSLGWLLKGLNHAFKGEGHAAVNCTHRALKLSPLDPHRYYYDSLAAVAYLSAHKFEHALRVARRSYRANRTHTSTLRALAVAQWQLGLEHESRETVRELMTLEPNLTVSLWRERSPSASYRIGQEWADVLGRAGVPD